MARIPNSCGDSEHLRKQLLELLENFETLLESGTLRDQVRALVLVHRELRHLGSSLVQGDGRSARDRILRYLLQYPSTVIDGEELMVVAGISEYGRRIRELRVQFGWKIITGMTLSEMSKEEDGNGDENAVSETSGLELGASQYFLQSAEQDREAAFRWSVANEIRKKRELSVRDKILQFLLHNVGKHVTGEELRYVAGDKTEWARRTRELRTEFGWPVVTKQNGDPSLPVGVYLLESDRQAPEHERKIPDAVRREVLRRDDYRCRQCEWTRQLWNRDDPRNLEVHHVLEHFKGGTNEARNLVTLCNVCHDEVHSGVPLKSLP